MSELIIAMQDSGYSGYLRDESRSTGQAESISFPATEAELRTVVGLTAEQGLPLTIQGARTGLTAGAVPQGGHVINLSRMNRITGLRYDREQNCFLITVQAGVLLSTLREKLSSLAFDTAGWSRESLAALSRMRRQGAHHFTPDPTETSASIGGMINCNASGARSFHYGPTRDHVQALGIILADGSRLSLARGAQRVRDGCFSLTTDSGRLISGCLPHYPMPAVKNASGYFLRPEMDLLDLFVGSEGTLGIVTAAELRLLPVPAAVWGVTVFFPSEESALLFVRAARGELRPRSAAPLPTKPVAIEFFNAKSLDLLRQQRAKHAAFGQMQALLPQHHTAIYVEFHGNDDQQLSEAVLTLGELIAACGGDERDTWVARNAQDMRQLQFFRHAIPESVNMLIDERRKTSPALTKLGTDMAVPDRQLIPMMQIYNQRIASTGLDAVAFGHIGDNHVHVNILPRDMNDYRLGKELYLEWARQAVSFGGTVSAEHGIGKLKTAFLAEMYGSEGLEKMRAVKRLFDPACLLSPGNMFAPQRQQEGRDGDR